MSALGQKRTCAAHKVMSALPPIATSIAFFSMSAWGQKRTSIAPERNVKALSALPPEAGIDRTGCHVRFVANTGAGRVADAEHH